MLQITHYDKNIMLIDNKMPPLALEILINERVLLVIKAYSRLFPKLLVDHLIEKDNPETAEMGI